MGVVRAVVADRSEGGGGWGGSEVRWGGVAGIRWEGSDSQRQPRRLWRPSQSGARVAPTRAARQGPCVCA
jgi:hypothetical protein